MFETTNQNGDSHSCVGFPEATVTGKLPGFLTQVAHSAR